MASGRFEVNASLFGSRLVDAVIARDLGDTTAAGVRRITLENAPVSTRTWGGELLVRVLRGPFRVTGTYAFTSASEWDEARGGGARRAVALIPRHTAGLVASVEKERAHRLGLELYYTGHQTLKDNPYRTTSQAYLVVGMLAERTLVTSFGSAQLFVNAENLLDVRQTRVDPLLLPAPGMGGRRTTDVWSLLEGRTLNAGVRLSFAPDEE
jgi:iron complex outermembrane receptor protein